MTDGTVLLSRRKQEEVFCVLMSKWAESSDAKEYVEKAEGSAPTPAASSASTPADPQPLLSEAQKRRRLSSYYKTHCYYAYGGQLWLKFLIATGNVSEGCV